MIPGMNRSSDSPGSFMLVQPAGYATAQHPVMISPVPPGGASDEMIDVALLDLAVLAEVHVHRG